MRFLAAAFLALFTTAAQAQSPDCSLSPLGWETNTPLTAATDSSALDKAQLTLGKAGHVTLHAIPKIAFATPPERKPDPSLHGGLVAVTIPTAGNYRVGLSSGAWIDVLQEGKPVTSTAHGETILASPATHSTPICAKRSTESCCWSGCARSTSAPRRCAGPARSRPTTYRP